MLYNLFKNRDFVSVFAVALLAEGVDRNCATLGLFPATAVALLAEGVDRNDFANFELLALGVALLAEGVDRNPEIKSRPILIIWRPPRGGRG